MKSLSIFFGILLVFSAAVYSDGIPYDRETGRVTTPHERLKLTATQKEEYARTKRLTLTPEQHQKLAQNCPKFPAVIEEVLPHTYNDCTCCVGSPYAILLPGGNSIAIPRYEITSVAESGVRPRPNYLTESKPSAWNRFWSKLFPPKKL